MKSIILIITVLLFIYLFIEFVVYRKKMPAGIDVIDLGQYDLLLGCNAKQVFLHYRVTKMHGLSLSEAEDRIAEGGSYIDGLCNYHPRDKDLDLSPTPFLFLNIESLQNNYSNHKVYLCVMHECMHMAGLLYHGCWDSHEEEMITWAEKEADIIINILKKKKYL